MNKKFLGIDYGRSKVGIAIGVNGFAEPLKVIHYKDLDSLKDDIKKTVDDEGVGMVIVGISEGDMGKESLEFSKDLSKFLDIQVGTFDETLTTRDAKNISMAIGVKRKKRQEMEDAYAASLILQNYLDHLIRS